MTSFANDTERLSQLMSRKRELLTLLRDLGKAQWSLIQAENMTHLLRLLSAKQPLVDELRQVDTELAPYREIAPEQRVWSSPQSRATCQADAQACETLLAELLDWERKGEVDMRSRRDQTQEQLREMETAAVARSAYLGMEAASPGQLDMTVES
jgi:multidrug resistance efflux pump